MHESFLGGFSLLCVVTKVLTNVTETILIQRKGRKNRKELHLSIILRSS